MSSISIWKTKNPMHKVFAVVPGEMINIQVNFGDQIPYQYRLQVLDQRNNSRLNRYGKGSDQGIELSWPIPRTIRAEHHGIWQIQVETDIDSFGQKFYVEHLERIEPPMLVAGPSPLELVEEYGVTPVVTREPYIQVEEPIYASKTSVTAIKGIGKTYANRLVKIQVYSISEFLIYPDRISLAEVMRISDTKLHHMLQDAKFLISKEVERPITPDEDIPIPEDLLSISGIGPKSIERLAKLGISSRLDLVNFDDLETLRKTLRMSIPRLTKVLTSIDKSVDFPDVIQPEALDPLVQPVNSIKGIGPKTAQKLNQRGILTVQDLLNSSFALFKDSTSETTYNKWKKNAAFFAGQEFEVISPPTITITERVNLTSITGIGVKTAQQLNAVGVMTLKDLVEFNLEELTEKIRVSKKRLTTWQAQAKKLLS
ncbi:MAG: helix-hairpin-helix domain-containing protein [Candidatus Ranarchaeia archaeon]|jgi:predicted flap endonuclease-1-like 5' DNA nuclease